MYKLIFADDEAIVRRNVAKMVSWEECGFVLLGCCTNGHELLEMVERERPDIVIADINMPFINGIDAARQIRAEYPGVQIVFLSGHNEFQYAQQAIDIKAIKYILKPISPERFYQALSEIKAFMDNEFRKARDLSRLEKLQEQNKALMSTLFLHRLLLSEFDMQEACRQKEKLSLQWLEGSAFCAAAIKADPGVKALETELVSDELVQVAVLNVALEMIEEIQMGSAILMEDYVVLIFCCREQEPQEFYKTAIACAGHIQAVVENNLWFTVSIGLGQVYDRITDLVYSYGEAVSALGYRKTFGYNHLILIDDIEPHRGRQKTFDRRQALELMEVIKSGQKNEIEAEIEHFFEDIKPYEWESMRIYAMSMLLSVLREGDGMGINLWGAISKTDIGHILEASKLGEIQSIVFQVCETLSDMISKEQQQNYSQVVQKAKEFTERNYSLPDLCADMVSEHLHLSASYFRKVFKKEMEVPFGNYLTRVRMQKAQQLIKGTEMRSYEIAEAVGYSDPHYFSYCFKRYFDMSPNEMRGQP